MNHLDINTIIDYVMINEINEKTKNLASDVSGHIRECEECRETVNAYLNIYSELIKESEREDVYDRLAGSELEDILSAEREKSESGEGEL